MSLQIRAIFAEHTAIIEPLSLDEAYLDVTENLQGIASAIEIAERIKAKIRAETQLTASAGVSYNKFLAKLASDHRKPDGLFVITPEMGPSFIEALAVERFHGVGPATAAKMKKLGIFTARDLRAKDEAFLLQYFGSTTITFGYNFRKAQADTVAERSQMRGPAAQVVVATIETSAGCITNVVASRYAIGCQGAGKRREGSVMGSRENCHRNCHRTAYYEAVHAGTQWQSGR